MRKSKPEKFLGTPFYPLSVLAILILVWLLIPTVNTIEVQKPLGNTYRQGTMKDGSDQFVVYLDKGDTKWHRVIVTDNEVRYISEYPCLIVKENLVKIRIMVSQ